VDKKLLIVGGDSWTDPNDTDYVNNNITKIWPSEVCKFLDWDLINTAKGGADNLYVAGQIIDAIEKNKHKDIVVMALWSQAFRLVPFDLPIAQLTFNIYWPQLEPPFGPAKDDCQLTLLQLIRLHLKEGVLTEDELIDKVANSSLRQIYMLDSYCKNLGIPIIHHRALHTLAGIEWLFKSEIDWERRARVLEVCKQNYYYQKISKFDNVVGNPDFFGKYSACFDMYEKYYISEKEKHPNEAGHQLIAHSFVNKYIELYEERSTAVPSYVYN